MNLIASHPCQRHRKCAQRWPRRAALLIPLLIMSSLAATVFAAAGDLDPTFGGDGKVTLDFGGSDSVAALASQPDGKLVVAGFTQGTGFNFALARFGPDGRLDPTFGDGGRVTTGFGVDATIEALAIQPDGRLVVAGSGGGDLILARYTSDGVLDTSFGTNGRVITDFGGYDVGRAVAIQGDGKIIVAGSTYQGGSNFALARYNPDGSLDPSFGAAGRVTTDWGHDDDEISALTLLADGKMVVAGASGKDFALARYNPNGSLDASFDGDGRVTTDFAGSVDGAEDLALQPDGKLVVTGRAWIGDISSFALARYNPNGSLDTGFGAGGKVITAFHAEAYEGASALAVQSDGKIVVVGSAGGGTGIEDFAVARYHPNGNLDTSFDGDGRVTTDVGGDSDQARSLVLQSNGTIVVAGTATVAYSRDFALVRYMPGGLLDLNFEGGGGKVATRFGRFAQVRALALQSGGNIIAGGMVDGAGVDFGLVRYTSSGRLDPTFGSDGKVITDFAGGHDGAYALALQPDGKIVMAGYAGSDFAVARYHPDGSLDTNFHGDGRVTTDFALGEDQAHALALQADGRIVVAGYAWTGSGASNSALARYNPDGSLDPTFGGDGLVVTDFGDDDAIHAVAIQADGKIVVAGYAFTAPMGSDLYDFALARYNQEGSLDATFDGDGLVTTDLVFGEDRAYALAIQADGKIVATGAAHSGRNLDFAVVRYNSDGSLDPTFGTDGRVVTDLSGSDDVAQGLVLQADGKLVVVGRAGPDLGGDFALVRYTSNGDLDTSFGSGGKVITDFGREDGAFALAIRPLDNKIVAAGYANIADSREFALARYDNDLSTAVARVWIPLLWR